MLLDFANSRVCALYAHECVVLFLQRMKYSVLIGWQQLFLHASVMKDARDKRWRESEREIRSTDKKYNNYSSNFAACCLNEPSQSHAHISHQAHKACDSFMSNEIECYFKLSHSFISCLCSLQSISLCSLGIFVIVSHTI